jgi:DDE domain
LATGASRTPAVKRVVMKSIPDETTRLAGLKDGEFDIAYPIRGELAEELQHAPGLSLKSTVGHQARLGLDVLVQRRRNKQAAKRLLRKLLKRQMRPPRVMIADKLSGFGAAKREVVPGVKHRQHKGLNNRAEKFAPADTPTRAADEAVQICRPGAALPFSRTRADRERQHQPTRRPSSSLVIGARVAGKMV